VHTLAISNDSRYIIAGTGSGAGLDDETNNASIASDAIQSETADISGALYTWDNQDNWTHKQIVNNIATPISLRTSPDGSFIICQLSNFSAYLFERSKWLNVPLVSKSPKTAMSIIAIAPDSSFIVTTDTESTMTIWLKAAQWIPLQPRLTTLNAEKIILPGQYNQVISSLSISPKSNYLITQEKSTCYTIQKYSRGTLGYILCSLALNNSQTESERDKVFQSKLFLSLPLSLQTALKEIFVEKTKAD
jgi:hypothetical protein